MDNIAQENAQSYMDKLEEHHLLYRQLEDTEKPIVRVGMDMGNWTLECYIAFDDDGTSVHLFTAKIVKLPEDRLEEFLYLTNSVNRQYRWLTFSIDDDHNLVCECDAVVTFDTVGDICYELLSRCIGITDKVFSTFMKTLYGGD